MLQNERIQIYGKRKYVKLLNNLLTKSRLYDDWFNDMVKHTTKDAPIKIFLLEGTNYKNRLYGKASYANVVLIFVDEMIENMNDWWRELLLCVTIHEIMHLAQSTKEYYQQLRYIPVAEKKMEQDADLMTWKIFNNIKKRLGLSTSLRIHKFVEKVAPKVLDISMGETWDMSDDAMPLIKSYHDSTMEALYDELDIDEDTTKAFIVINDEKFDLFNSDKDEFNYRNIEFLFFYTEFYRVKHGADKRVKYKKNGFILEYDKDIFNIGSELFD